MQRPWRSCLLFLCLVMMRHSYCVQASSDQTHLQEAQDEDLREQAGGQGDGHRELQGFFVPRGQRSGNAPSRSRRSRRPRRPRGQVTVARINDSQRSRERPPYIDRDRDPLEEGGWKRKRVDMIRERPNMAPTMAPVKTVGPATQNTTDDAQIQATDDTATPSPTTTAPTNGTLTLGAATTAPNGTATPTTGATTAGTTAAPGGTATPTTAGTTVAPGGTATPTTAGSTAAPGGTATPTTAVATTAPGGTETPTTAGSTAVPAGTETPTAAGSPLTTTAPANDIMVRSGGLGQQIAADVLQRVAGVRQRSDSDVAYDYGMAMERSNFQCKGAQEIIFGIDIRANFPQDRFKACSRDQFDGLKSILETTLNLAFPEVVTSWPDTVKFHDFYFDVDQFALHLNPFADGRNQRHLLRKETSQGDVDLFSGARREEHINGRRRLQEATMCPPKPTACGASTDLCMYGCGFASIKDCGDLTLWRNLGAALSLAVAAQSLECLGGQVPPIVNVMVIPT